jgi:hypothetical protein
MASGRRTASRSWSFAERSAAWNFQ